MVASYPVMTHTVSSVCWLEGWCKGADSNWKYLHFKVCTSMYTVGDARPLPSSGICPVCVRVHSGMTPDCFHSAWYDSNSSATYEGFHSFL